MKIPYINLIKKKEVIFDPIFEIEDEWVYIIKNNGEEIGRLELFIDPEHGKLALDRIYINEMYRRRGLALKLLKFTEDSLGKKISASHRPTDIGFQVWKKYRPSAVKDDLRNHDYLLGKKIITENGDGGTIVGLARNHAIVRLKSTQQEVKVAKSYLQHIGIVSTP